MLYLYIMHAWFNGLLEALLDFIAIDGKKTVLLLSCCFRLVAELHEAPRGFVCRGKDNILEDIGREDGPELIRSLL